MSRNLKSRDVNLGTADEIGVLLGKGGSTVRDWIASDAAFAAEVVANVPGKFRYFSIPALCRYIYGDDAAAILPSWIERVREMRTGQVAS